LRKRIYWVIQDKTLAFGYLGVVVALVLFFNILLPELLLIALPVSLVLFGIHAYEYFQDFSMWRQREGSTNPQKSATASQSMSLRQAFRIGWKFVLASLALSALTFGFVGLNRYFDKVWNSAPNAPQVFTAAGQLEWFVITLIAVLTGAILLGALAVTFPWALVKGAELKNLWDIIRHKKQ